MKQLSRRLRAVADMVPRGAVAADIGCDHGLLCAALLKEEICPRVIAIDVSAASLDKTRRCALRLPAPQRMEIRHGDGFAALMPGEADVAVVAGLSAETILAILKSGGETAARLKRVIVQPMSRAAVLRGACGGLGWRMVQEELVQEGGRFFCIMAFERGDEEPHTALEQEAGWLLLRNGHPLMGAYLKRRLAALAAARRDIARGNAKQGEAAMRKIDEQIRIIEEGLPWLRG